MQTGLPIQSLIAEVVDNASAVDDVDPVDDAVCPLDNANAHIAVQNAPVTFAKLL